MARVLGGSGFAEEVRPALLEAIQQLGNALAVENRLPAPGALHQALQPPLAYGWGKALPVLQGFVQDPEADWRPAAEWLATLTAP